MCTPYENKLRAAVRQPSKEEIKNCGTHLLNLINLSPRKGVIAVGKVAASVLSKLKIEHHEVAHPTAILGQSEALATVWMKRTILLLKKILFVGKYCNGNVVNFILVYFKFLVIFLYFKKIY